MLTPYFEVEQNEEFILLTIKAPYIKTNDVEIYIEDFTFKFFVKPYFLRLTFPCEVIEDGRESAKYDIDKGVFSIKVPKKTTGEYFPNLDMLTKLLAPKRKPGFQLPTIEVMNDDKDADQSNVDEAKSDSDEDSICWETEQELPSNEENVLLQSLNYKYGFANQYSGVFEKLQNELDEVIDLTAPEKTSPQHRWAKKFADEEKKFNTDHYIADYVDAEYVNHLVKYEPHWEKEYNRLLDEYKKNCCHEETVNIVQPRGYPKFFSQETKFEFTEKEREVLQKIPNKDFILTKEEEQRAILGMVDILFAYAYNHRTTEGENTSESPWTICKLSGTLSWLCVFNSLKAVIKNNIRRSLCYPLYRNWALAAKVFNDVKMILCLGRRWILRCLLQTLNIFQCDENKYILNDLYIKDYCIWIQTVKKKHLLSLANEISKLKVTPNDVDLNLEDVEKEFVKTVQENTCEIETSDSESESGTKSTCSSTDSSASLDSDDASIEEEIAERQCNSRPAVCELQTKQGQFCHQSSDHLDQASKTSIGLHDSILNDHSTKSDVDFVCTGIEELMQIQDTNCDVVEHKDECD